MGIAMDTGGDTGTGFTMATGLDMHVDAMRPEMPTEIPERVLQEEEFLPETIPGLT